jgi:photosystem II stability/assembly factor-like uncharacterized protein
MASSSTREAPGGIAGAWPAYALVVIVLAASVVAFAHRPLPEFQPTQIYPDRLLINGIAASGKRVVAVGEQGHILYGDTGQAFQAAKVEPARGSTLTRVVFVDEKAAIAIGHDGWILRSEDAGASWKEAVFDTERTDPFIGIAGPFDGKLFAFGAFGLFATSTDQGRTWNKETLAIEEEKKEVVVDENADPFANFSGGGGGLADRHLNAMVQAGDGSLLLLGEQGLMLRSADNGANWKPLPQVYAGSWFGAMNLPDGSLLAFGMRGNAFFSRDNGNTWKKSELPLNVSLFGGAVAPDGRAILVGDNNAIFASSDHGERFTLIAQPPRKGLAAGLAAVLPLANGDLLIGGDLGLAVQKIGGKS